MAKSEVPLEIALIKFRSMEDTECLKNKRNANRTKSKRKSAAILVILAFPPPSLQQKCCSLAPNNWGLAPKVVCIGVYNSHDNNNEARPLHPSAEKQVSGSEKKIQEPGAES